MRTLWAVWPSGWWSGKILLNLVDGQKVLLHSFIKWGAYFQKISGIFDVNKVGKKKEHTLMAVWIVDEDASSLPKFPFVQLCELQVRHIVVPCLHLYEDEQLFAGLVPGCSLMCLISETIKVRLNGKRTCANLSKHWCLLLDFTYQVWRSFW